MICGVLGISWLWFVGCFNFVCGFGLDLCFVTLLFVLVTFDVLCSGLL